jgi:hypothetical protein
MPTTAGGSPTPSPTVTAVASPTPIAVPGAAFAPILQ